MRRLLPALIFLLFFVIPMPVSAAPILTNEKLITVDLGKQTLFAWQNGQVVHQTKVSSGLPKTPTVKGSFKIRTKVPKQNMRGGGVFYAKYNLKDVPNVMYFYQAYAIHEVHIGTTISDVPKAMDVLMFR